MTIDFSKIERFYEVCRGYDGYFLEHDEQGDWVRFEDVVAALASAGVSVKSFETIRDEKWEKEMREKYGPNWK